MGCHVRPLTSFKLCQQLGLIEEIANAKVNNVSMGQAQVIKTEFAELFEGVGTLNTGAKYSINLKDNAKPYSPPARRVPPAIAPKVKAELERMV